MIFKNNNLKCYSGYASCEISSHGELWDCAVNARSFGNLRKNNYDFKKVWNSRKAKKIRENIKTTKCFCNTANPNYTNILCDFRVF